MAPCRRLFEARQVLCRLQVAAAVIFALASLLVAPTIASAITSGKLRKLRKDGSRLSMEVPGWNGLHPGRLFERGAGGEPDLCRVASSRVNERPRG